jgi:hypothetical protein
MFKPILEKEEDKKDKKTSSYVGGEKRYCTPNLIIYSGLAVENPSDIDKIVEKAR